MALYDKTLPKLANVTAPKVFAKVATERCRILSTTSGAGSDDWGGESESEATESVDIPCVFTPRRTDTSRPNTVGAEYLDGQILMPTQWPAGTVLDVKLADRIKILSRPGANPERVFEVKNVANLHGVYYDLAVTKE